MWYVIMVYQVGFSRRQAHRDSISKVLICGMCVWTMFLLPLTHFYHDLEKVPGGQGTPSASEPASEEPAYRMWHPRNMLVAGLVESMASMKAYLGGI